MQNQTITILDVAKDAGVSPATVSRVLNHNLHVDPALKDRVLASIQKLNYLPNANAQSLITRNTYEIGYLVSDISNSYYSMIAHDVESIVSREKYNILLCSTDEKQQQEYIYLQTMLRRHVDALILNPSCLNNDLIVKISKSVPVLLMNRKIDNAAFHGDFVDTDGYLGCRLLTEALLQAGHRRIYCVCGPEFYPNARERFRGFVDAMAEHGITVDDSYPYVFNGQFTIQGGKAAVEQLRHFSEPPTAILSENNMSTVGILQQLRRYHISIPGDISLASHDHIDNMELFSAQPVSAVYDLGEIARCVGTAVLQRIRNFNMENRSYIFSPSLSEGNSIAPPSDTLAARLAAVAD